MTSHLDIVSVFRRAVERHHDRPFLIDANGAVTYGEAHRRSSAAAAALVSQGVAPGDTVGFCGPDGAALWLGIIGAWKAGALPGLIDAQLSTDAMPYFVGDVDAPVVASSPERRDDLVNAGARAVIDLDGLSQAPSGGSAGAADEVEGHGPDAPLYLSYTSGTTGAPKGVVLRSLEPTLATSCIANRLGLHRNDVLLATTPIPSSFQLVAALMPAIHTGAAVALVAGRPVSEMWEMARKVSASVLVAYPLTLADMVNAPGAGTDSPFRVALSGGSPLAPRIKRDYRDKLGVALLESYGQSELGGFMAMGSPDDGDRALEGFVGRSLPDRMAWIGNFGASAGPDGYTELPAGEVGEVLVGHGYFAEYRNKPHKFAETTAGGVLHTGDLAISDADGYLKVLGRTLEAPSAKARGGFLRELEDALYDHPAVLHAAVVDPGNGNLACFYETQQNMVVSPQELKAHAAKQVPEALLPASLTQLEAMPRTFSGKADRLGLTQKATT